MRGAAVPQSLPEGIKTTVYIDAELHTWARHYGVDHGLTLKDMLNGALVEWAQARGYAPRGATAGGVRAVAVRDGEADAAPDR
jgi:hypothetical protein